MPLDMRDGIDPRPRRNLFSRPFRLVQRRAYAGTERARFWVRGMSAHPPVTGKRPWVDLESLSLGRRAAYRRVLAALKAQPSPYVVVGAFGLSLQLGELVDGDLELYMREDDVEVALKGLAAA